MTSQWVDYERAFIARRYDRIAGLIGLFDRLLFLPSHLRRRATTGLRLKPGDRVLEIGCGTGRNLPFLRDAVGPAGKVYGVDLSSGMLRRARALCRREQWENVELRQCDGLEYIPREPLDGIMFGLCYNTMPHHLAVLRHAWSTCIPAPASSSWTASSPTAAAASSYYLRALADEAHPARQPFHQAVDRPRRNPDEFEMEEFLWLLVRVLGDEIRRRELDLVPAEQLLAAE